MIPVLYDAYEKSFTGNGIGFLKDAVSCMATEERNGIYELELIYPVQGQLAEFITEDAIIKAKANDDDPPQLFRIYKSSKPLKGNITWSAEHISYELNSNPVEKFSVSGVNAQNAMQHLFDAAVIDHEFIPHSDITTANSTSLEDVLSVRNILGGTEGSILDVWGGEYWFNNYDVWLKKERGSDNGVTILYGKNLITAEQEKNIANVVTAIFPYAYYTPEGAASAGGTQEQVYVSMPEKVLIHDAAVNYATVKCVPVDLSDQFDSDEVITVDKLRAAGWKYLNSGVTEPNISIKLTYQNLSKAKDYKNLAVMEKVKLCDIVTVRVSKLKIDVTAKIEKVKYNVLKERYEELEVGSVRANLAKSIATEKKEQQALVVKTATRAEQIKAQIEKVIKDVTAAITGNSGGYVLLYPAENPQEIFIMDTPDTATAKNVWRWNLAGLGHSDNGIGGTYTTAITADGQIVADFITAGELTGLVLKAGTVHAEALDVEYRTSVTTYTDEKAAAAGDAAKAAAIEEMTTKLEQTADAIRLYCDKLSYDAKHDYVENGDFTSATALENWYYVPTANISVANISGLGTVAQIIKNSTSSTYIRQSLGRLPAGTYVVKYKAAAKAGNEATARIQCSAFNTTKTTTAGELKSTEFTEFTREITVTSAGTYYIYLYNYVNNTTIYITGVEVLGKMDVFTKAELKVNADAITAEVSRATEKEGELAASIKVNANAITLKVTSTQVESIITQKADSIRLKAAKIAWTSTYSSMTEAGVLTCTSANIQGTVKCGNSTGYWVQLASTGKLTGGYGSTQYGYIDYSASSIDLSTSQTYKGIQVQGGAMRISVNLLSTRKTSNVSTTAYIGATGTFHYISKIQDNGNGTITWWESSVHFENGLMTSSL